MNYKQYENTLKALDRWAIEAGDYAKGREKLDDKVKAYTFKKALETARRTLRVHIFDAEDVSRKVTT